LAFESHIFKRSDTTNSTKNAEGILVLQVLKRKRRDDTSGF
jgi:hypothetical protein